MESSPFSIAEWRAINLAAQGLLAPPADVAACVRQLGYVQIDSIQVAARAHQHVLHSRMADFTPAALDQALAHKRIFEYWSHAAAYLPMDDYRFSLPRKLALRGGDRHWFEKDSREMQRVLERIRAEGPLKAADFESKGHTSGPWWDWKPAKKALEQLFMEGELMVVRRDGFQKVFDLTERVLPDGISAEPPTPAEYARHLIRGYLKAHGHGSAKSICYLRSGIKTEVSAMLNEMRLAGELERFRHQGEEVYFSPSLTVPELPDKVWLLNPFDNLLIQRGRLKQWFDFDYQIEVYVPEEKRRFGYYCLAVLWRDRFVGRLDVKAERDKGLLRLKRLTLEPCAYDDDGNLLGFIEPMAQAINEFCRFNGLSRWKLEAASNATLKRHFSRQVWV
ncbi:winged helix DNA-binding domain-containing protein [Shewanella sp. JM162201]|uniref:Winged helix DNA-binding domain-containing protein n=1 Tax=Shewanella jiangmenensis TaxID=2837387 RepID=A0ABS5V0D0_9GAMM|nr:crosslink repair DNA glycosylase YcaQ family protein [Shewanella jiangmenensis]MBT1443924.1 winged helix DNA-binding domain-containing protein [Shewanella jiangmenensis]